MGGALSYPSSLQKGVHDENIRFVEFHKFQACGRIPRSPDDLHRTTEFSSLRDSLTSSPPLNQSLFSTSNDFETVTVSLEDCFMVFISHRWCRAGSQAVGYDGRPEPDNSQHDKHKLCVAGIQQLWDTCAKDLKYCFLWMDYSCINQNINPARELNNLAAIMQLCDCVFTPIVEADDLEQLPGREKPIFPSVDPVQDMRVTGKYSAYGAVEWASEPEGYLHRSWCRLELYYGAFTPRRCKHRDNVPSKDTLLTGLLRERGGTHRAHFLYTSCMHAPPEGQPRPPAVLPPPQRSLFSSMHPLRGWLTKAQDSSKIKQLVAELLPLMKVQTEKEKAGALMERYVGEYNEMGQREGYGRVTMPQQGGALHSYVGQWENNEMHGTGTYSFGCDEDGREHVFTGTFSHNTIKGYGKHQYCDGSSYEGQCVGTSREGYGVGVEANGDIYEGEYVNDLKEGVGKITYAKDGSVYEGDFRAGAREGKGRWEFGGGVYEGSWEGDKMQGSGVCHYITGDMYTGQWHGGMLQGQGEFRYKDGDVYVGGYVGGKEHGQGRFRAAAGGTYEGGYVDGKRHGFGRQEYPLQEGQAQCKVYEGDFVAGRLCGTGCITYPDGSTYCGGMKDDMRSGEGVLTLMTENGGVGERGADCSSIYRGSFKLGKRHGQGVLEYPGSGDKYVGTWVWDTYTQIHP